MRGRGKPWAPHMCTYTTRGHEARATQALTRTTHTHTLAHLFPFHCSTQTHTHTPPPPSTTSSINHGCNAPPTLQVTLGPGDYSIEETAFWSERVYSHVSGAGLCVCVLAWGIDAWDRGDSGRPATSPPYVPCTCEQAPTHAQTHTCKQEAPKSTRTPLLPQTMRLLNEYGVVLEGILLKPNMCLPGEKGGGGAAGGSSGGEGGGAAAAAGREARRGGMGMVVELEPGAAHVPHLDCGVGRVHKGCRQATGSV